MPAKKSSRKRPRAQRDAVPIPSAGDWRSTDEQEILRRVQRARDEKHAVTNLDLGCPVISTFAVRSPSGMSYQVEIRDLKDRSFSCTCPDFRTAGLGTCKHVEATLIWLKRRFKGDFHAAGRAGSPFIDLVPAGDALRIERNLSALPRPLRMLFDNEGQLSERRSLASRKRSQDRDPHLRLRRTGSPLDRIHAPQADDSLSRTGIPGS